MAGSLGSRGAVAVVAAAVVAAICIAGCSIFGASCVDMAVGSIMRESVTV